MTNARLIDNWLGQPEEVGHSLHAVGGRLLLRDEVQGVHYRHGEDKIVVISTQCDLSRSAFPKEVKVFGVDPRMARPFFEFFNRHWATMHGNRDGNREINDTWAALNAELSVPLPPRLIRAERGLAVGRKVCGLLAFFDYYVPSRYRYAMPTTGLDMPRSLVGGTWSWDEFIVFESDEDAVAAKMGSSRPTYIIDLHGTEEVIPPPLPEPDDGPLF